MLRFTFLLFCVSCASVFCASGFLGAECRALEPPAETESDGLDRMAVQLRELRVGMDVLPKVLASPSGDPLDQLLETLEADGDVTEVQRIRLTANDQQAARVQFGSRTAVVTGRMSGVPGGRGQTVQQSSYENIGTILQVQTRVHGDWVTLELEFESSRFAEQAADADLPPSITTETLQTTLDVKFDESMLLAGSPSESGSVLVVSVSSLGRSPRAETPPDVASDRPRIGGPDPEREREARMMQLAVRLLERFDRDGDGTLEATEVDSTPFQASMSKWDTNGDGKLDQAEIAKGLHEGNRRPGRQPQGE